MRMRWIGFVLGLAFGLLGLEAAAGAASWTLVGWNDLGMHCMDDDYSVFSLLPPYNVIHAQLTDPDGNLVTSGTGLTVTYEAVADPTGSITTTSSGKTGFWSFVEDLFGAALTPDQGLAGFDMPGAANAPQAMRFDADRAWWSAEGIPIAPIDDAGKAQSYPLMRLTARDGGGHVLATTDIVLPVSSEMDCRGCHGSDSSDAARPAAGWVHDPDPSVDFRLNVLRLHDERRADLGAYAASLAAAGYDAAGLFATATGGTSVLCARCHTSNALPGTTVQDSGALTHVIHAAHATVVDPKSGLALGAETNRSACYTCHPGAETRCLRGAMGSAVAADGSLAMQCQSCHGSMAAVGAVSRNGWLEEPTCQNCHTGTATHNAGQIRYTSAFEPGGAPRVAPDATFATTPDAPAPGLSLYRFSSGHGGLACEACHGSTHAELPSSHANDNLQSVALQGHVGMLSDCTTCHASVPFTADGGPHGMHGIGGGWVGEHGDVVEHSGSGACRACHGLDYRGSELSDALGPRSFSTDLGSVSFFRGARVTCYACHAGPGSEDRTRNRRPNASDAAASTALDTPVELVLAASDPEGSALLRRIIEQPSHGTVGLAGDHARYVPEPGFTGTDTFRWAAFDGSIDSNLATGTVAVGVAGPAPQVDRVKAQKGPFRIALDGAGFADGVHAFVGDATWLHLKRKGATRVVLTGGAPLKTLFPKGTFVPIRVENPDGQSATVEYDRGSKTWR